MLEAADGKRRLLTRTHLSVVVVMPEPEDVVVVVVEGCSQLVTPAYMALTTAGRSSRMWFCLVYPFSAHVCPFSILPLGCPVSMLVPFSVTHRAP